MVTSWPHLSLLFSLCLYNNLFILTLLINLYFHLSLMWIFPLHPLHYLHIHLPVLSSSFPMFSFHCGIWKNCLYTSANLYKSQSCTYIALLIILVFYYDLEDFHFFLGSLSLLHKNQGYGMWKIMVWGEHLK